MRRRAVPAVRGALGEEGRRGGSGGFECGDAALQGIRMVLGKPLDSFGKIVHGLHRLCEDSPKCAV
jgi:hypothetical protein